MTTNGQAFEKSMTELEEKILQLETINNEENLAFRGEIRQLRDRLTKLKADRYHSLSPWERVALARHPDRPGTSDYIPLLLDEFLELHGDKCYGEDRSIRCGFGRLNERKVLFIGHQKGKTTRQKIACNFGSPHPEGYRKALDKMLLAEKSGLPIITLINTPGAYPGIEAEERGQSYAIAINLMRMAQLKVPVICTVIGEGGSGGALGIGIGDVSLMLQNSYYSVISPEGCASILYKDASKAEDAANALRLTAKDNLELGIADEIIPEPQGGAHTNVKEMGRTLKQTLHRHLNQLTSLSIEALLERRYDRLRRIGEFATIGA